MADTWYADGLAFACTRCGNCCRGAPGTVWVNDDELRAIAKFRGENALEVEKLYTRIIQGGRSLRERVNGDCVFWTQEEGCTIYPVRPRQCRTWPFWNSNLQTPETWEQAGKTCPGVGKGDLIPVEEITWRMNVIRI
jgi:Fe-S-cluster containining protein